MRRIGVLLAVAVLGLVVLCVRGPERASAVAPPNPNLDTGVYVLPGPMVGKLPSDGGSINVAVAANQSACLFAGAGVCVRIDCKTAQCDYRYATLEPDAGWPTFPDAGFALPGDMTLPADTPEGPCLPGAYDSICAFFEGAGTLQVAPRYPGNGK